MYIHYIDTMEPLYKDDPDMTPSGHHRKVYTTTLRVSRVVGILLLANL